MTNKKQENKKKFEEDFPLFSKDLPTFEDWIPSLVRIQCYFYDILYYQYKQHLKNIGIYEEIQEIHNQHRIKYEGFKDIEELKLWLKKYPKYYPECEKIWGKNMANGVQEMKKEFEKYDYNQFDDEEWFNITNIIENPNCSLSDKELMELCMDYCRRKLGYFKD